MRVSTPSVRAPRMHLPPVITHKAREPHPAWRVVDGDITMANLSPDDQMDEDTVEQELLGLLAAQRHTSNSVVEASQPVQLRSGYPAHSMPQRPVSPPTCTRRRARFRHRSPCPPILRTRARPCSSTLARPFSSFPFAAPTEPKGGWAGCTQPQPSYAPMPMYGAPGVAYAPPQL